MCSQDRAIGPYCETDESGSRFEIRFKNILPYVGFIMFPHHLRIILYIKSFTVFRMTFLDFWVYPHCVAYDREFRNVIVSQPKPHTVGKPKKREM